MNRQTRLAIAALETLGVAGERSDRRTLAEETGTSVGFLPQVMRPLVRAGWVVSHRGPTGGYELIADPDEISILEIIEAVEGPVGVHCVLRGGPCSGEEQCSIHASWSQVQAEIRSQLGSQRIKVSPDRSGGKK